MYFYYLYYINDFLDVDCGKVQELEHGSVTLADNRTTFGAKAVYTCHENYTLIGHEKRTCGRDAKWSDTPPQCLFDWCPDPPAIHGGIVTTSGHRAGDTATYTCQAGFILFGQGVSNFQRKLNLKNLASKTSYLSGSILWSWW